MPKLPILSGKNLIRVLKKYGYREIRRKGSHVFIESEKGDLGTVIPIHSNEDLGKGILKSILKDLKLSVKDLLKMLQS